jgi:hypothetical protein
MRFSQGDVVDGLSFHYMTAGWVLMRDRPHVGDMDVIAGAFDTPEEAIDAAKRILASEIDQLLPLLLMRLNEQDETTKELLGWVKSKEAAE